jgi:hypothetical protein
MSHVLRFILYWFLKTQRFPCPMEESGRAHTSSVRRVRARPCAEVPIFLDHVVRAACAWCVRANSLQFPVRPRQVHISLTQGGLLRAGLHERCAKQVPYYKALRATLHRRDRGHIDSFLLSTPLALCEAVLLSRNYLLVSLSFLLGSRIWIENSTTPTYAGVVRFSIVTDMPTRSLLLRR